MSLAERPGSTEGTCCPCSTMQTIQHIRTAKAVLARALLTAHTGWEESDCMQAPAALTRQASVPSTHRWGCSQQPACRPR